MAAVSFETRLQIANVSDKRSQRPNQIANVSDGTSPTATAVTSVDSLFTTAVAMSTDGSNVANQLREHVGNYHAAHRNGHSNVEERSVQQSLHFAVSPLFSSWLPTLFADLYAAAGDCPVTHDATTTATVCD